MDFISSLEKSRVVIIIVFCFPVVLPRHGSAFYVYYIILQINLIVMNMYDYNIMEIKWW